jgi:hypothetical protein
MHNQSKTWLIHFLTYLKPFLLFPEKAQEVANLAKDFQRNTGGWPGKDGCDRPLWHPLRDRSGLFFEVLFCCLNK